MCNPSAAVLLITGRGSVTAVSSSHIPISPARLLLPRRLFPSSDTSVGRCRVVYKRLIDLSSFICGVLSLLLRLYLAVKAWEIFGLISHPLPFQNTLPVPSLVFGCYLSALTLTDIWGWVTSRRKSCSLPSNSI